MQFSTVLAIALCVTVVSAAPDQGYFSYEVNKNHEDNSNHETKKLVKALSALTKGTIQGSQNFIAPHKIRSGK